MRIANIEQRTLQKTLFPKCNMKPTSLTLNCSALLNAECAPTDLHSHAIQSLEANPTFRRQLESAAIQIESAGDTLVLSGRLPSYYLKQQLQETVRRVAGVGKVENQVLVVAANGLPAKG